LHKIPSGDRTGRNHDSAPNEDIMACLSVVSYSVLRSDADVDVKVRLGFTNVLGVF